MARKLRLQFPGALYHVINRGNYRRDVFASVGAAQAFVNTLGEACARYDWRVHAYAVLPNHYHVALETPGEPGQKGSGRNMQPPGRGFLRGRVPWIG